MDSPVVVRKRYQRFFAWTFVFATMLALGMFWVELAFRPRLFRPLFRRGP